MAQLEDRRILITGAAGFIGSRVAELATNHGALVTALIRPGSDPLRLMSLVGLARCEGDVEDVESLRQAWAAARPEIVVHAAGRADWRRDPTLTLPMMGVHALGTARVLEVSRSARVQRVVVIGSAGEYGAAPAPFREGGPTLPLDAYSASKLAATELALTYHRAFGLASTVVRPFVVYGPGENSHRLFPSLFSAAQTVKGGQDFTEGHQIRDFVYVDDVAEGVLRAAVSSATPGKILNLGTGQGVTVRDAVQLANSVSGNHVQPRFGALPSRVGEPAVVVADMSLCQSLLSWIPPTSLEVGLTKTWGGLTSTKPISYPLGVQ